MSEGCNEKDLLIIGGGPAGMSAAIAAAEHGVSCTVVDEAQELGGQIYRAPTVPDLPSRKTPGDALRARIKNLAGCIDVRRDTRAWGIFDEGGLTVALNEAQAVHQVRPKQMILAAGAYEYVPPFPGWTLPGVMTPGAAQILAKTMGISPGRRVMLAGTGPFLLAVACELMRLGVEIAGVLEASPRKEWWKLPLSGWRTPGFLLQGMGYLFTLMNAGVPVHYSRMALAAEGDEVVERVVHARVDRDWNPDRETTVTEEVDALLVGYGFVPRVGLAQVAGCEFELRPEIGGWVPERDRDFRTTVPGVFSVGDGAGVAGALVAGLEGRIAGLAAAAQLGRLSARKFASLRRSIDRKLGRIAPIRAALDRTSTLRSGLQSLVEDETVMCRCEEVTASQVDDAVKAGGTCYRSLKVTTRVGMGACQGRFCWPAISKRVADQVGCSVEDVGQASPRPPIRPVALGAFVREEPLP